MAEGRGRAEWERTSLLAFLLAEANRDREQCSDPFTPDYFNPYSRNYGKMISDIPLATDENIERLEKKFTE